MKGTLLFFIFTFSVHSQKIFVTNEYLNILYLDIENFVTVAVEGCNCSNVKIKTNNGTFYKTHKCNYIINPDFIGELKIEIYKGKKLKGTKKFRVEKLEPLLILNSMEDELGNPIINTSTSLLFRYKNTGFDLSYNLEYFVKIIRKDQIIYNNFHNNRIFNSELTEYIRNMKSGDLLIFHDVQVTHIYTNKKENINGFIFTIP